MRPTRRVLLHHHRRLDAWLQMGGHDEGESDPRATARREGAEESGLSDLVLLSPAILDVDVHPIPAGKGEPPHLHHDVRYALATRDAGRDPPGRGRVDRPALVHARGGERRDGRPRRDAGARADLPAAGRRRD